MHRTVNQGFEGDWGRSRSINNSEKLSRSKRQQCRRRTEHRDSRIVLCKGWMNEKINLALKTVLLLRPTWMTSEDRQDVKNKALSEFMLWRACIQAEVPVHDWQHKADPETSFQGAQTSGAGWEYAFLHSVGETWTTERFGNPSVNTQARDSLISAVVL